MASNKDKLLEHIRNGVPMGFGAQLRLIMLLGTPAMLAQLSAIVMSVIDASMVGSLGANASAAVGLVSTTIWLFCGLCSVVGTGFSVQVAHKIGASDMEGARSVLRQGLLASTIFSLALGLVGILVSWVLPQWLRAQEAIHADSSLYFMIFAASLPLVQVFYLSGSMLRCAGNMVVPAVMTLVMCLLDVVFNFFLIFPTRQVEFLGIEMNMPGAGLGVPGAALGTALSEAVCGLVLLWWLVNKSEHLRLRGTGANWRDFLPQRWCVSRAANISLPMAAERILMCGAQIATTVIVAPLGSIALSANSFGITAESLCYMPGYGISEAATTLVGQSIGAKRRKLTIRFGYLNVVTGMVIMTLTGILMYVFAYDMMAIMSPVEDIRLLGQHILRIEAWAEPFFAAAIVCYGVMVGAGDTLIPSIMNLGSIWGVRIVLAILLVPSMGLTGLWIAMCIELCFRGTIFLWRLASKAWLKKCF